MIEMLRILFVNCRDILCVVIVLFLKMRETPDRVTGAGVHTVYIFTYRREVMAILSEICPLDPLTVGR